MAKVTRIGKQLLRWDWRFRCLRPTEALLLYAKSTAQSGRALWHSHPGNQVPHVHVCSTEDPGHAHSSNDLRYAHASHSEAHRPHHQHHDGDGEQRHAKDEGHWHLVIPAKLLRISHALLVQAVSVVWVYPGYLPVTSRLFRAAHPERAPPLPTPSA